MAGADVIQKNYGIQQDVRLKIASQSLVTETDLAAEAAVLHVLNNESQYRILSEESGASGRGDGPVWVVDPLDGTSNFARSFPFFTTSLALVDDDEILAGVIIDPIHNNEYFAVKGGGAFCNDRPIVQAIPLHPVPCLFLNHGSLPEDKLLYGELTRQLASTYNLRKPGATALELCSVAMGFFDGFICAGDEIWDYAAGAIIAEEAGSIFCN